MWHGALPCSLPTLTFLYCRSSQTHAIKFTNNWGWSKTKETTAKATTKQNKPVNVAKPWSIAAAAAAAKSLQSCPTLCDLIDGSPPGSAIPGILQARTLEWVAVSFFNAWKWKVKVKSLSHVWLLVIPWTASYQAPPPMGFSRQEYWSGVPLPSLTKYWWISFKRRLENGDTGYEHV